MVDVVAAPARTGTSYVEWGAVFAGALAASAISFVLLTAGASIGLSLISPYQSESYGKAGASIAVFCVVIKPGIHALPAVGGIVLSMVVVLLLGSLLFFSSATDPLVPALQSEGILALHVGFMLASYGALSLSFGAGVVRLIQGDRGRIAALPPAQRNAILTCDARGIPDIVVGRRQAVE